MENGEGGKRLWGPEPQPNVPVSNGLFSVRLGSQTAGGIPDNVFSGGEQGLIRAMIRKF